MSTNFRPMRMRWNFVIGMASRDLRVPLSEMAPADLARWGNEVRDLFPDGLRLSDAVWILANPEAFTDGEP
jgi:hypothetical protein